MDILQKKKKHPIFSNQIRIHGDLTTIIHQYVSDLSYKLVTAKARGQLYLLI